MRRPFPCFNFTLLLMAVVLVCPGVTPAAGILKIETKTTVRVEDDILHIRVEYINRGSAPAHQLQVNVTVLGTEERAPITPQLEPGQSNTVTFQKDVSGLRNGRYPLMVAVDFHDANQYPFSALSGMTFFKGTDVNAELIAESENMTIQGEGMLRFTLKNLSQSDKTIETSLFLPKEFSASELSQTISLDGRSEKRIDFEIENFSALPGATYPVFCFFEYDTEAAHHTALARSMVFIEADENLFRRFRWLWITLAAMLSICLIAVVAKERKKQHKG